MALIQRIKFNATIQELVFFKPLPSGKYLNLAGLYYAGTKIVMHIYAADDKVSKGVLWAQGEGIFIIIGLLSYSRMDML